MGGDNDQNELVSSFLPKVKWSNELASSFISKANLW